MGNDLSDLYQVLDQHLGDAIGGVHILPLYPSNADSGFSPLTHTEVDPVFGSWADVERISARYDLCLDLTINHISDESLEFQDFLRHGPASTYADLFVQVDHNES
jgi:sucrose phosphorylase